MPHDAGQRLSLRRRFWNVCPTLTWRRCTEWLLPPVDALHPGEATLGPGYEGFLFFLCCLQESFA